MNNTLQIEMNRSGGRALNMLIYELALFMCFVSPLSSTKLNNNLPCG
jgi:hypothetical protein